MRSHSSPKARSLHISSTKRMPAFTKNEMRPTTSGNSSSVDLSRRAHRVEHVDRGGQRVRDLFDGRRARLLQVVRAHVDRVPLRDVAHRVAHEVDGQPARRLGPEDVRAAREVLLHDVVLGRARELRRIDAALLGEREVHAEQPHGGGVDRHRRVHLVERDAVEQRAHRTEVRHGDADLADLAARERVVGVVAGLGREVERHRQPGLALGQVRPVELVGGARGRVTRVRPHQPGLVRHGHILPHGGGRTEMDQRW